MQDTITFCTFASMFYEQMSIGTLLFAMLYGGTALAAAIACLYLCLRRGNAFAADITPSKSLRHWAAAFYANIFLSHVWWGVFCIYFNKILTVEWLFIVIIDVTTLLTTIAGTLFSMLQDSKRYVWPVIIGTIPYMALQGLGVFYSNEGYLLVAATYITLFLIAFTIYMVWAVRQYGRWLRDNYADLEHKEVWGSHVVVIIVFLLILIDEVNYGNIIICFLEQITQIVLFGFLLWRVETLPQLAEESGAEGSMAEGSMAEQAYSPSVPEDTEQATDLPLAAEETQETDSLAEEKQTLAIPTNIDQLLEERCVGMQLYLRHDLTLLQLAQSIGTNRLYLSQYFSTQGTTYNAYINDLRINHFMRLYREAAQTGQPIIAQQLAKESGYRSYSTFSLAFKQRMGQSVSAWMHETNE